MSVLVIDNYDSFTWNLVALLRELGQAVMVFRNDTDLSTLLSLDPSALLISPGPGRPADAGCSEAALSAFAGNIPILGVCLGHQLIGEYFGASLTEAPVPVHGKTAYIQVKTQGLFQGMPNEIEVMRYHSLILDKNSLPDCLELTAQTREGLVMGIHHKTLNLAGVQFHPESIGTPLGAMILQNWINSWS